MHVSPDCDVILQYIITARFILIRADLLASHQLMEQNLHIAYWYCHAIELGLCAVLYTEHDESCVGHGGVLFCHGLSTHHESVLCYTTLYS